MTKKQTIIYKIIISATLILPISLYIFFTSLLVKVEPNIVTNAKINDLTIVYIEDGVFIYDDLKTHYIDGHVVYNESVGAYGVYVDNEIILKAKDGYFSYDVESGALKDVTRREMNLQKGTKIPLSVMFSIFATLLVALIIGGKMEWQKKKPRLAAFIALLTTTIILYIINSIIGGMLGVFVMATISWGLYSIEYLYAQSLITKEKKEESESKIMITLREAFKELSDG